MVNMSDHEIVLKVEELVQTIKESKVYQEHKKMAVAMEANANIMDKIQELKDWQKKYVKSAYLDEEIKAEMDRLTRSLEEIPLYVMYEQTRIKLDSFLEPIKEGMNLEFKEMLSYFEKER